MRYNPLVDSYIQSLPSWQQDICLLVRELVHSADERVEEVIKRTDRPYFVLDGNICALMATKDHVNVFLYDPIAPDPKKLINQGSGNLTARSIQLYQNDKLDEVDFVELVRAIIANNRAGGWRKVQKDSK